MNLTGFCQGFYLGFKKAIILSPHASAMYWLKFLHQILKSSPMFSTPLQGFPYWGDGGSPPPAKNLLFHPPRKSPPVDPPTKFLFPQKQNQSFNTWLVCYYYWSWTLSWKIKKNNPLTNLLQKLKVSFFLSPFFLPGLTIFSSTRCHKMFARLFNLTEMRKRNLPFLMLHCDLLYLGHRLRSFTQIKMKQHVWQQKL